jgi:hypothetical protein
VKRHAVPVLLLVSLMVGIASLVLGVPNISQAIAFFAGGTPTSSDSESVAAVVVWLVILVAGAVTVVGSRLSIPGSRFGLHPTSVAELMLAAGMLILVVGSVQHLLPSASVCCGSGSTNLREAIQLAR